MSLTISQVDFQENTDPSRISSPISFTVSNNIYRPILIVFMNAAAGSLTSVTYGGESMTKQDSDETLEMWYLLDPKRGANDFAWTWSGGSSASDTTFHFYTFKNVKGWRSGTLGTEGAGNGAIEGGNAYKTSISCTAGDMMVFGLNNDSSHTNNPYFPGNVNDTDQGASADIQSTWGIAASDPDDIGWQNSDGGSDFTNIHGALEPAPAEHRGVVVI